MRVVERTVWTPYSAKQMYALVNDITKYPGFLPGCKEAKILHQDENEIHASLIIHKSGIEQEFSTRNVLDVNRSITMHLLKGPFRYLHGVWNFEPKAAGCEINFILEFEFQSKLMDIAFGPIFEGITSKMVHAFVEQAREIYE